LLLCAQSYRSADEAQGKYCKSSRHL